MVKKKNMFVLEESPHCGWAWLEAAEVNQSVLFVMEYCSEVLLVFPVSKWMHLDLAQMGVAVI